ncbi:hypothetical protein [Pleomorphomonas carboxyditropha]|uniref:Flagellar hook-length control protein-like C-terminal domain-containing protein n=1 Tax=Pleomorphomonas carboxyditropha TaxID=2023338 RepID=A0A2G9WXU4_9HYPH|nr:hypothetical protein [Pleomorphomonas carboxyditropha]PIO99538.1 hypothetical protein CJ014_09520 [Pleomorphomonas carboxyditropha]
MAIGPLPPVISEIQANSGQPGKTLAQQTAAGSLVDLQAAATAEPATAILPETTLIERAVAEALGRQGGLAPLYATLAGLADAPELPDAVKAAINAVLAFRLGDGDVTPERVAEAIRSSGVFHEAVAAGRMAAALSPAVRQALGGAPEDRRQATARPATPTTAAPATTPAAARQAPAVPAPAPPIVGAPAAAAQAYGRQGGLPASTAAPIAPQVSSAGNAAGPSAMPGAPAATVAAAPAASLAAPSAAGGTSPVVAAATTVPPSPLLPTVQVARDASAPTSAQVPSTGGAGAQPAPTTTAGAAPSSPTVLATPAVAGQPANPPPPASGGVPPSTASSLPASEPPEVQAPTQPSPAASPASPANASASSRSFAPWTPGRPLTPAAPMAASPAPAGSSADVGRPASPPSVIASEGGETPVSRPAGERAPFVPSDVESLPRVVPGPAAPRPAAAPVASSVVPDAPAQPGATPSAASPQPVASQQAAGQASSQVGQPATPQARPAAPAVAEVAAPPVRQPTLPTAAMPPAAGVDLKGALEVLRRELVAWLGRNADVMASLDGAGDDAAAPRIDRPPPPRKGGPVRGQPAVPLVGEDASEAVPTETLAGRALGEAERSLSRVFLHQAATADGRDAKAAQPTPALMLEIPIAGPNGTSVAQLRIERDDHAPSEPGAPPRRVFQVDIAFDIAPLGPVAVRVGLMDGRRVAVGVWCESDDGLVRMEAERENIVLGLEQEGMVVAGVDLHRGHPPEGRDETAAAASHRLDLQL